MIKLLYRIPQPHDAISLYRGLGPLGHLSRKMGVQLFTANEFYWSSFSVVDALYMVRPSTDMDRRLVEFAKDTNTPVWIDYDDNILDVPTCNPAHTFYAHDNVQANIRYCISNADVVSVSTPHLAKEFSIYRPINKPCVVIPNAFPNHLFDFDKELPKRQRVITWRGSRTHDRDLAAGHEFFKAALTKLPDWQFMLIGEPDWATRELFPKNRMQVINSLETTAYFKKFHSIAPTMHVVPLRDNSFNRSKSNIAWIEASYAGAMTLGPNLPEWDRPGILNDWHYIFEIIENQEHVSNRAKESRDYIYEHLLLDTVNLQRAAILEMIV